MLLRLACLCIVNGALCGFAIAAEARGVWLDVPFVAQERNGCGAAAVAMVMQYWQQATHAQTPASDAERILRELGPDAAHGIYASALIHYFRQNGYRAFAFTGQWADLEQHLAEGRPLIAAVKPGAGLPLHYVVVAGLDPEQQLILLNDPARRKLLKEEDAQFEREWKAAGHWTLLALPASSAH